MAPDSYDTTRDYQTILRFQIEEGLKELERPAQGQFLSSLSCGLTLGIGVFSLLMVTTVLGPLFGDGAVYLLRSGAYTFGFVLAIMSQTELFTEHTTLAVFPVLSGDATSRSLGRLWTLVFVGNIVGGTLFAGFISVSGPALDLIEPEVFIDVASTFIELSPLAVVTGGIMAGWLMALLSWIHTSVGDSISRIAIIIVCTFPIGFGHLPHCVAGNIEVIAGMLAGAQITLLQWAQFLALTTVGNIVGGVVFVALLNYSHVVWGTEGKTVAESIEATEE
ncbi:formate/nitrite transporter family protein [Haloplanus halobius]|uniref:formate/nitrite transporter family protein n=1 Tax=Haloplanus halobius TaxID=2934938 RepID=UPI00200D7311|nr:formate/nitrite transporter family protein [Haloplanus sp. XH21]